MGTDKINISNSLQEVADLNVGAFGDSVSMALDQAGAAAVAYGLEAEVTINLKIKQIGDGRLVKVVGALTTKTPTSPAAGNNVTECVKVKDERYIHRNKKWSQSPEEQGKFEFNSNV